jgi:HD-GYP domain-containing protein (c-di-GMP phosphodiesterase class II)/putative methionine-R-sulfoxide reductase with GAF domain
MTSSFPILTFAAILPLTLFLGIINLFSWKSVPENRTSVWLASWLAASGLFALFRLLQYLPLELAVQVLMPRLVFTALVSLAWFGIGMTDAFLGRQPSKRERNLGLVWIAGMLTLVWFGNLVLTWEPVIRYYPVGGAFYGVEPGSLQPLFLLFLLVAISIPIVRLWVSPAGGRRENRWMAIGFLCVLLVGINDILVTVLDLNWPRLAEFGYLPVAILFNIILIQRYGLIYREMNDQVQARTDQLSLVNKALHNEIDERRQYAEKIRRQAAEMTALYETTHDLVIEHELSKLLQTIVERAAALLHSTGGGLYLCEPEQRQVRCVVSYNTPRDYTGTVLKYGEGAAGRVAETGKPVMVDDYRTWPGGAAIYGVDQPFVSVLSVPMLWQARVIGVIHILDNSRPKAFTKADLRLLTQFANQAAVAVENISLFEAAERRRQEAAAIAEVSRDISASLQLDVVLERISAHAKELLRAQTSAVYLYEAEKGRMRAIAAHGLEATEIKNDPLILGDGILGDIALHKVGEIVNDNIDDPRVKIVEGTQAYEHEHIMGVPLQTRDQLTGLIVVWRIGLGEEFLSPDLDFLTSLARQAAIAIENARLFEETRRRLAELEILQTIASALRIAQKPEETFPILLDQLVKLLAVDSAMLELIDQDTGEIASVLALGVWSPITGQRTPPNIGVSSQVIASHKAYVTTNIVADGLLAAHTELVGGLNHVAVVPIIAQHQPIGTLWVGRPTLIHTEEVNLLLALGEMLGNTIQRMRLHETTVSQAKEISQAYDLTLEGWAKALELRDKETEGHSRRVTILTLDLASRLGISELELSHLYRGVLLHDIGKMGVPDQILKKPGPLDAEEWAVMRCHPQFAYDLLFPITFLRPALDIPYCHHEKWDGSGYPHGLCGEQIPLGARIFAVVDVYDALSHDRPYHHAWSEHQVYDYLRSESGKHFDPQVV